MKKSIVEERITLLINQVLHAVLQPALVYTFDEEWIKIIIFEKKRLGAFYVCVGHCKLN